MKDTDVHKKIIDDIVEEAKKYNLYLQNLTESPIKGTKGNTEYLAVFSKEERYK